jgi:hypothetical protein
LRGNNSNNGNRVAGLPALAELWSGVTGQVEKTVRCVDFPGANIAIVHVATQYSDTLRRNEIFVAVKQQLGWNIWLQLQ